MTAIFYQCATTIPQPYARYQRIPCLIFPFRDVQGNPPNNNTDFESTCADKMNQNYSSHYEEGPTSSYNKTIYYTNVFKPLLFPAKLLKSDKKTTLIKKTLIAGNVKMILVGSVKRIKVGRIEEIDDYISGTWLSDIPGPGKRNNNSRAAFVEYAVKVISIPAASVIGTMTIQGAFESSSASKKEIIHQANRIAAEELVYRLNDQFAKFYDIKPKRFLKY
jgi:hypothetical protein